MFICLYLDLFIDNCKFYIFLLTLFQLYSRNTYCKKKTKKSQNELSVKQQHESASLCCNEKYSCITSQKSFLKHMLLLVDKDIQIIDVRPAKEMGFDLITVQNTT